MELLCPWESAQYFIFSSNVPPLLFYSHLTAILTALIFSLILAPHVRESLPARLFLGTIFFFTIWTVIDLPLWALNRPDINLFLWSTQVLTEVLVYAAAFYFAYTFISQKDIPFTWKLLLTAALSPILLLLPTSYLFPGVDISTCVVIETSFVIWYTYAFEILVSFLILFAGFSSMQKQPKRKKEIALFIAGLIVFLIALSSGNIIGSITENWDLAQVGLFGMPVFIAFLTYTVVKFKTFNAKLIAAQALVFSLAGAVLSLLFLQTIPNIRIVAGITFVFVCILGYLLVRSVKKEIEQREHIEKLALELEATNERQETLIHFIGHEVKGFLTKDAGALAALVEGDLGPLPEPAKPFVSRALAEARSGVDSVGNILKASNLKKGTVAYEKAPFDLKALVAEAVEKAKGAAEARGLALSFTAAEGGYQMTGDKAQISDHVLRNLIDNAVNYTPAGSIAVSLKWEPQKLVFAVKDSGIGITEEDKKRLFTEGGHGKDSQKVNAHSTGYGLYIAKQIVEAHGGSIRAESEGAGKGSTFIVEFPV